MNQSNGNTQPKFNLGALVATPGALNALEESGETPLLFLKRHVTGDWGDLCAEDRKANDNAIAHEGDLEKQMRVFSTYKTKNEVKIWIITEYDRSVTTILLPSEY
ncbi:MAG: hypothetical protein CMJ19_15145 [Phycisphaeraceae bacterium]|nr:hypothetical protein [Phycisphaeraceae bacterium]